ncbi:MAG TPA: hypothetical protein VFN55_10140 [Solirubrobacteraceae bacterium]|nr:hypothetical protein [Solirubrobacteraceae bacterium]
MPTELIDGLYHWTAVHPHIRSRVSSYYVAPARAVIDPIEPEEGWDALPGPVDVILLTSGNHNRGAAALAERTGAPIRTSRAGAERLGDSLTVEVDPPGTEVAPGITSLHLGGISPDEGAYHVAIGPGAVAFADGVIHTGSELDFVPDHLIGDEPERVKSELGQAFRALLEDRLFDILLFAHGEPVTEGGHQALSAFADQVLGSQRQ